jgi:hypothetical protein
MRRLQPIGLKSPDRLDCPYLALSLTLDPAVIAVTGLK